MRIVININSYALSLLITSNPQLFIDEFIKFLFSYMSIMIDINGLEKSLDVGIMIKMTFVAILEHL